MLQFSKNAFLHEHSATTLPVVLVEVCRGETCRLNFTDFTVKLPLATPFDWGFEDRPGVCETERRESAMMTGGVRGAVLGQAEVLMAGAPRKRLSPRREGRTGV